MRLNEINDPNKKLDIQSTLILGNHSSYYSWYKSQIKILNSEKDRSRRINIKNKIIETINHLKDTNLVHTTVLEKWLEIVSTK